MINRGFSRAAHCAVTSLFMASVFLGSGAFTPLAQLVHAEEATSLQAADNELASSLNAGELEASEEASTEGVTAGLPLDGELTNDVSLDNGSAQPLSDGTSPLDEGEDPDGGDHGEGEGSIPGEKPPVEDDDTSTSELTRTTLSSHTAWDSELYLNNLQAKPESYTASTQGVGGFGIEKAFDGNYSTMYSASAAGEVTITMTFSQVETIDRFILKSHQLGSSDGYPTKFSIRASETGAGGSYKDVVTNFESAGTGEKLAFQLSRPFKARSIQFVVHAAANDNRARIAELKWLRYDEVETTVGDLFADELRHTLKDKYNSEEFLTDLQAKVDTHFDADALNLTMERAWMVYKGEVQDQNDRKDWPLYVYQKTGPDYDRAVWVFLAEGYQADEMDKAVADVKRSMDTLMGLEPYRGVASIMNIYIYMAQSWDSGYARKALDPTYHRNTYFNSIRNDGGDGAAGDASRVNPVRDYIEKNMLDKAPGTDSTSMMHATLLVNKNEYFGSGGYTSVASSGAGAFMISHEGAHFFAGLGDEYADTAQQGDNRGANMTTNSDPNTIRWKEFLGLRGTSLIPINSNNNSFLAHNICTMHWAGELQFCEVCRETVWRKINTKRKDAGKLPMYVAQPQLTVVPTESEKKNPWDAGKEITESNITDANGRQLEYRTVVSYYNTTSDMTASWNQYVNLHLKITGADGTVKVDKNEDFNIWQNTFLMDYRTWKPYATWTDKRQAGAVDVRLTTDTLTGLEEGDQVEAEVTYKGEILGTYGNIPNTKYGAKVDYGAIDIAYKEVDAQGNVIDNLEGVTGQRRTVLPITTTLADMPELYGYEYVRSELNGEPTAERNFAVGEGETLELVRYYRSTSNILTMQLVDEAGNLIQERTRRVRQGEEFTPKASDFTVSKDYELSLPEKFTMGSKDVTITYTVKKKAVTVENVALNKTGKVYKLDGSDGYVNGNRGLENAWDGKIDTNSYADFAAASNQDAVSYVELDLGGVYQLQTSLDGSLDDVVRLWRYWGDKRTYNATAIVASAGGTFEDGDREVLYNSDAENIFGLGEGADKLYAESASGLRVSLAKPTVSSKIRVYMSGSSVNKSNHIVELEVYGSPAANDYASELETAIDALTAKVTSGVYLDGSLGPAQAALQEARRKLVAGSVTSVSTLEELLASLSNAEGKLRMKDECKAQVTFLGGALRYSGNQSDMALRMGYWFRLPEGAQLVASKSGWSYGLGEIDESRFRAIDNKVSVDEGGFVANAVLAGIPATHYGTLFVTRAQVTYTLNGAEHTVVSDETNARSVNEVATRIEASSSASDRERKLAAQILSA